jgi:hypothetical protein
MNRTLWTVIGIVLLAAGVVGLLAGYGALSFVDRQRALLTQGLIDAWNRNQTLATALTIVGGLLLTLLGALLLRAQRGQRAGTPMRDLHLRPSPEPTETEPPQVDRGGTEVASRALHRALRRDFESDRQVRNASVRLTGPTAHPQLLVRLAVTPDADIARLAGHVDRVVNRFATTSGVQPDLSEVVLRIPERAASRVE